MSKLFAISDQHYGHENIIKYCNRQATNAVEDMKAMVIAHNEVVTSNDLVIFVGDVSCSWQGTQWLPKILKALKGRKILVKGNHDHLSKSKYVKLGFESVHDVLRIDEFLFCHYPDYSPVLEMAKANNLTLVCGHTHKPFNFKDDIQRINVAVDVLGLRPKFLKDIDF